VIGIPDVGLGNLGSVLNACRFLDLPARLLSSPEEVEDCRALILPGVGAFGDGMTRLRDRGYVDVLRDWAARDRPFLGICLGLQLLFERSEESPGVEGLGILAGTVRRFPEGGVERKVPQMGWNQVTWLEAGAPVSAGIPDGSFFYFVHSYYVDPVDSGLCAGRTTYGIEYVSAVRRGNLVATQFHPEKSQDAGLSLLRNFGRWIGRGPAPRTP
jgi:imidazole glycerol phosphate synthase glutamine amidotransferase subunit